MIAVSFCHFPSSADVDVAGKASSGLLAGRSIALVCDGPAYADEVLFRFLDTLVQGALVRAAALRDFNGKAGQVVSVVAPVMAADMVGMGDIEQIQLVGCAPRDGHAVTISMMMDAGGAAFHALAAARAGASGAEAMIFLPDHLASHGVAVALGATLRSYRFDRYRTKCRKEDPFLAVCVALRHEADVQKAETQWAGTGRAVCDGVFLTRDLVNEPSNVLYPESYRERIEALRASGLEVEVLDEAQMRKLGFGALLGVAQGSAKKPYTVIMRHYGAATRDEASLAFVGKGVTFDSGGISIKPAAGMDEMKTDMGGSAVVVGLMQTLAQRRAKVNAVGVIGLVENMLSGEAQRPGDIVTSHSGQTIEVLNTDAEGRLVLADLLSYTRQAFTPSLMVNLATLTGAIIVALGTEHAGLFSNDDTLAAALQKAGQEMRETLWRMPMGEAYNRQLDSEVADMKNIGGRPGSSILAAEFLKRFVGDTPWAHLDIAGTTWRDKPSDRAPKGATGYGVQLLDRFVQMHEQKEVVSAT